MLYTATTSQLIATAGMVTMPCVCVWCVFSPTSIHRSDSFNSTQCNSPLHLKLIHTCYSELVLLTDHNWHRVIHMQVCIHTCPLCTPSCSLTSLEKYVSMCTHTNCGVHLLVCLLHMYIPALSVLSLPVYRPHSLHVNRSSYLFRFAPTISVFA